VLAYYTISFEMHGQPDIKTQKKLGIRQMLERNVFLKPDPMRSLGIKWKLIVIPKWKIFGDKIS
jgi:hypothetical protein